MPVDPDSYSGLCESKADSPPLTNVSLVLLQVHEIVLEHLVIALLAAAGEEQLEATLGMVAYILPRQGFTPHLLTTHAAAAMISLVDRVDQFRGRQPSVTSIIFGDALKVSKSPRSE